MKENNTSLLQSIIIRGSKLLSNYKLLIWSNAEDNSSGLQQYFNSTYPRMCLNPTFIINSSNRYDDLAYLKPGLSSSSISKYSCNFKIQLLSIVNQGMDQLLVDFTVNRKLFYIGATLEDFEFEVRVVVFVFDDGYYVYQPEDQKKRKVSASANTNQTLSYDQLSDIVSLQRKIDILLFKMETTARQMDVVVLGSFRKKLHIAQTKSMREKLNAVEVEVLRKTREIEQATFFIQEKNLENKEKSKTLQELRDEHNTKLFGLVSINDGLELTKLQMRSTYVDLVKRQCLFIQGLKDIYPIENDVIKSAVLPSNLVFTKVNKEDVATALGFSAHYVSLIAQYLKVPLRYKICCKSSRSYVVDLVTPAIEGSRNYPLYSLSGERHRFDYAVFLLCKNIQQIMNLLGIEVKNLKAILQNILSIQSHLFTFTKQTTDLSSPLVDWKIIGNQKSLSVENSF